MILNKQLQKGWYSKTLTSLVETLSKNDKIYACWVEGSIAQGQHDDQSDLDLWVLIEDQGEEQIFKLVEESLSQIGNLDINYQMPQFEPKIFHKVYHFAGTSEFQTIDLNLQYKSRDVVLAEGDYIVIFDKNQIVKSKKPQAKNVDWPRVKERLRQYYALQYPNIIKNLDRDKLLEAKIYYDYLVEFIIKTIRLKYLPEKYEYGLKHIYRDLPKEQQEFIEEIALVKNAGDFHQGLKHMKLFVDSFIES